MIYRIKKWIYIKRIKFYERQEIINKANAKIDKIKAKGYAELLANIIEEHILKTGDI